MNAMPLISQTFLTASWRWPLVATTLKMAEKRRGTRRKRGQGEFTRDTSRNWGTVRI